MNRIHTDGACRGNPGPGGWAWASGREDFGSGAAPHTTNQRMEVMAVIEALREHPEGAVEIVSDSNYVVKCFHDRWYEGWKRRNWKNSKGQPVANQDLWETLISLVLESGRNVTFFWVKGHSGDVMNDFVDQLATAAADTQRGQHS
ncbi:MAG TPA: ribonuclease H [Acidimicrobiales bacterium]|jgi:ribonuclease HI|nr:ribonuclease H [Acidimicrobiales bacterium]